MPAIERDEKRGILYRAWRHPSPKAILLLVHGLGAHSERWAFLSDFFLRNNISSYAIELKGFGETNTLKGHIDSFDIYFKDILSLNDIIVRENGEKKIFLLSESMGAIISLLLVIREPGLFNGLVCISPAFMSRLKFSVTDYIKIFSSLLYNPKRQFNVPFNAAMCTHDAEYQKVLEKDPREYRVASSKLLVETAVGGIRVNLLKNRIKIPLLFLLAGKDELVNPKTSRKVFNAMKLEDKTLVEYPEMRHALSIELEREKVFGDILNWLRKRV